MTAVGAALRSVRQQLADGFSTLRGSPRHASTANFSFFLQLVVLTQFGQSSEAVASKELLLSQVKSTC